MHGVQGSFGINGHTANRILCLVQFFGGFSEKSPDSYINHPFLFSKMVARALNHLLHTPFCIHSAE